MENHPEKFKFLSSEQQNAKKTPKKLLGTSIENPIKAVSIADEYNYLNNLRIAEGKPVKYERIGSMRGKNGGIIDGYKLFLDNQNTMKIYIDSYATENSTEAHEGFVLPYCL